MPLSRYGNDQTAGDPQSNGRVGEFRRTYLGQRFVGLQMAGILDRAGNAICGNNDMHINAVGGIARQRTAGAKALIVRMGKDAQ